MKHLFYRCKIQLDYPAATRLLLIEANSTLTNVHNIIQLAFELDNDKDYHFYNSNISYLPLKYSLSSSPKNLVPLSPDLSLKALKPKSDTILSYLYDSKNPFLFHITIEKLCCANTDSTSPRLLQYPKKAIPSDLENPKNTLKKLLGNEFL